MNKIPPDNEIKFNITLCIIGIIVIEILALVKGIDGKGLALAVGGLSGYICWKVGRWLR